ncbi:SpvB/TcaC N-terminal domain-containing protein [Massilia sp. Se16.2.3]|uniref:SpvB/TcaC N-terminal domain-containing protein n=1 Tax=Massilia sp. Se16.2.3 TaxID=2709303 RepID=UPI0015FFBBEA|nr:SpvB/TcaC N-terminal domain-containing protein [Massilia sp. Se16.2.3]QNB00102.1 hypothetical protein G4G31_16900 [Massilia sp. Se16.2.3]
MWQERQAPNSGASAPAGAQVQGQGSAGAQGAAPSLALPKGGGAIRGIGEKFEANSATGSGSMTIPITTSPGRSGFGPQLALHYDSGNGNGPTGFGWQLGLPNITRKTSKGVPRYLDAAWSGCGPGAGYDAQADYEPDVFILSGAEDLVPVLAADGRRHEDRASVPGYTLHRYRPRVDSVFARIERWTRDTDGDIHWRVWSADNLLTVYGLDPDARIADPAAPGQVFSWLICETRDDRGNAMRYVYKRDDGAGIDLCAPRGTQPGPCGQPAARHQPLPEAHPLR